MTNPVLRLGRESATATQQSHRPHSLSLSLIARLPPAPGVFCVTASAGVGVGVASGIEQSAARQ